MKIKRLICLLLVIVLLMSCFWILADMPAFTAEGAFRRAERRSFLQESTFLGVDFLGKTHVDQAVGNMPAVGGHGRLPLGHTAQDCEAGVENGQT